MTTPIDELAGKAAEELLAASWPTMSHFLTAGQCQAARAEMVAAHFKSFLRSALREMVTPELRKIAELGASNRHDTSVLCSNPPTNSLAYQMTNDITRLLARLDALEGEK